MGWVSSAFAAFIYAVCCGLWSVRYCRIHQCIDINMLATKLNMDHEAAERWIVNLIRNARLDAKIDSVKSHVLMGNSNPSVYQQVPPPTPMPPPCPNIPPIVRAITG